MKENLDEIFRWLNARPALFNLINFIFILLAAYISYLIAKKILTSAVEKIVEKTRTVYDDILLSEKMLKRLSYLAPLVVIDLMASLVPAVAKEINVVARALIIIVIFLAIGSFLTAIGELLSRSKKFKGRPIKGYIQVVKIIIYSWGVILVIGALTSRDPWAILGGLGALTAVIILVFKDTILSFVASIQISSYDLIKIGDWIEAPLFKADGDVVDISLNIVKIQNWDKSISVIPTYKLLDATFKNWRGMTETGGRRIKRSIFIDQSSVKFVNENLLEKLLEIQLLENYIKNKLSEIEEFNKANKINTRSPINGRRITNLGTFRAYLKEYLKHREDINKNLTFLVRQLEAGPTGIPIEIYVFANTTEWSKYEDIQADIFDHILAAIDQFELRVFQYPTGGDFKNLQAKKNEA